MSGEKGDTDEVSPSWLHHACVLWCCREQNGFRVFFSVFFCLRPTTRFLYGVGKLRAQARVCVFMCIHLTNEPSDLPSRVDMSLNWGTMHFPAVKTHALL